MRKTPIVVVALLAVGALGGSTAIAQQNTDPGHTLQMSVKGSKAGTKKKPRNVSIKLEIANNAAAGTTASRIEILFPKNIKFNSKGFPTCSEATLNDEGPAGCPSKSRLGKGTAGAITGPGSANPTPIAFENTFFVGSSKQLNIFLEQEGGGVVKVLKGKIGNAGGKYGKKLTIDIPADLQQPAPNVYAALTDIENSLKGTTGKGKKKHGFFESVGCTGGQYDFQSRLTYAANPNPPAAAKSEAEDTVACKK